MTYSTTTELTEYATARGIVLVGDLGALLVNAHDYIESLTYQGTRYDAAQTSVWPRVDVYVDGIIISGDTVPQGIKNAEMQCACDIDAGFNPLAILERAVKRTKVDVIEVEYADGASDTARLTKLNAMLRPYRAASMGIKRA